MSEVEIRRNEAAQRFEAEVGGKLAYLQYVPDGDRIAYVHTEVPDAFEGKGIGSQLVKTALGYAREQGLTVIPSCPFVASYIKRHPEYQDVVAGDR